MSVEVCVCVWRCVGGWGGLVLMNRPTLRGSQSRAGWSPEPRMLRQALPRCWDGFCVLALPMLPAVLPTLACAEGSRALAFSRGTEDLVGGILVWQCFPGCRTTVHTLALSHHPRTWDSRSPGPRQASWLGSGRSVCQPGLSRSISGGWLPAKPGGPRQWASVSRSPVGSWMFFYRGDSPLVDPEDEGWHLGLFFFLFGPIYWPSRREHGCRPVPAVHLSWWRQLDSCINHTDTTKRSLPETVPDHPSAARRPSRPAHKYSNANHLTLCCSPVRQQMCLPSHSLGCFSTLPAPQPRLLTPPSPTPCPSILSRFQLS